MASVRKNVVFRLGLITCNVKVDSAKLSEPRLRNACVGKGDWHDPIAVTRPLTCDTCGQIDHHNEIVKIDAAGLKVEEVKADAEYKDFISLVPVPMADLMAGTEQGEKSYILEPITSPDLYNVISALVTENPGRAFIAKWSVRTRDSLFVAKVKDGVVILDERVHEAAYKPLPALKSDLNEQMLQAARAMLPTFEGEWDSATYSDKYRDAVNRANLGASVTNIDALLATLSGSVHTNTKV